MTTQWVERLALALLVGLLFALGGAPLALAAPADDPEEYLVASETPNEGEEDYWLSVFDCPEFAGLSESEVNVPVSAPGDRVGLNCVYETPDGRRVGGLSLSWAKPLPSGEVEERGFCHYTAGNNGLTYRLADPGLNASGDVSLRDGDGVVRQDAIDELERLFDEWVRPRAQTCAPDPAPECPPVAEWLREDFFGPKDTAEWISNDGNDYAACSYVLPDPTKETPIELTEVRFEVTAFKQAGATPADIQRACSMGDTFDRGLGFFGTGGTSAIRVQYATNSHDPIDLDPFTSAAREMVATLTPVAATCDGIEILPNDPYTSLPAFYADVFDDDAASAPAPPIVSEIPAPPEPSAATPSEPATAAPATTVAASTTPTATPTSTSTVAPGPDEAAGQVAGDDGDGEAGGTVPRSEIGDDDGSDWAWLFTIVTVVAMVLSVLLLLVTFFLIRRASRVRPRWDVVRIVISAVVAIAMLAVFSISTPIWAIAVGVAAGGALGYWQGSQLVVELRDRGLFAKRGAWAIVAFTIGIALAQVARLLDSEGIVSIGLGVTFFSAALALGVYVGRTPRIADARAGSVVPALLLFVAAAALAAAPPSSDRNRAAAAPGEFPAQSDTDDEGPDPAITDELASLIDWNTVTLEGGLWADLGKPLAELSVPPDLAEPPEPLTRQVSWTNPNNASTTFSLNETFTFSLRGDGLCCSIDYVATGEFQRSDGAVIPVEFDARLADIQLIAAEGTGVTDPDGNYVDGLPFTEVRTQQVVGEGEQCHRPVAETRSAETLAEAGGDVEVRVNQTDSRVVPGLDLRLGTLCDLPGFTLEAALELAPEPPPADDEARQLRELGNCPVYSEVIETLGESSSFPGVSTQTLGNVIFDGNQNACEFGTLFEGPALGQGGRGGTRHEFGFDLAQPRLGEWDRGYDRWWPDPLIIEPATIVEPVADDVCEVDDRGVPLAPPGVDDGATCELVTQHEIPGGEIWIATNYDLSDGPDTEIRAELPWGSFFYRCHHCEPGDPDIVEFLDGLLALGNGAAVDVTYNETFDADSFDDLVEENDEIIEEIDEAAAAAEADADDDLQELADELGIENEPDDPDAAEPADTRVAEAEELVDLVVDDDATDAEREAVLAAVIGLLGAAAMGATSLRETGVGVGELWDRRRSGGADAVDDLLVERGAELAAATEVIDEDGEIMRPGDDGLYDWGGRRVTRAELEELIADQRAADAARDQRIESMVADQFDDSAVESRMEGLNRRAQRRDDLARERLEAELEAAEMADRTRQNVADHLADRAAAGGWDALVDRLAQGDSLSREELLELAAILDRLAQRQGSIDPETTGTYLGDLLDEFGQDAAAAQEAVAQMAEMQMGPLGGWMVRNPVAAGRIGAAIATGGFSEGLLTPLDVMNAMERAAEEAHAQGRDLTYAEAFMAGAWEVGPGMVIGHLGELGLSRFGRQLGETARESFDSTTRSVDEWLEAGTRSGDDSVRTVAESARERTLRQSALADEHGLHWVGKDNVDGVRFKDAPPRTIVPQSRIASEYGMREESYRQLRRAVERNGAGARVRSTSGRVPELLKRGAVPKPESIKIKTVNEFDSYMGMGDDAIATVPYNKNGWPEPDPGVVPSNWMAGETDELVRLQAWQEHGYPKTHLRWEFRQGELAKFEADIDKLIDAGDARWNPSTNQIEMKNDLGDWNVVTGDHDLFEFVVPVPDELMDLPPGALSLDDLSPAELAARQARIDAHVDRVKQEMLADLRLPPFDAQHGAHMDWTPVKASDLAIDAGVKGGHGVGGGDGLLTVLPGQPAHVTYYE